MADKPIDLIASVLAQAGENLYRPTNEQKRAKSSYWHAVQQGLAPSDGEPDLATALKFANDSRVRTWWDSPGFLDWFYNKGDFRRDLEFLSGIAIEELESILVGVRAGVKDKLVAIKLVLEASGKLQKQESGTGDDRIDKMTKQELESYIAKRATLFAKPPGTEN